MKDKGIVCTIELRLGTKVFHLTKSLQSNITFMVTVAFGFSLIHLAAISRAFNEPLTTPITHFISRH